MKGRHEEALAPSELRPLLAALAGARGRQRLDLILGARNPQALVRALPADDLYLTIREIGLADAAALVQLASAEQFKVFVDLEAWARDAFEPSKALPWLRAARAGAHREPHAEARWRRKLAALDAEVLLLILRSTVRIHDLEEDRDPEITSDRFMRTPDGKMLIEFLVDGLEYAAVRGVLDDLFAEDAFQATRLLSALRWELPSELEETALRWRTGRLADLGHPARQEALSWFSRPPRAAGERAAPPARPPGFFLAALASGALLDRAAARLASEERDAVEGQLVAGANAVLVADAVDPADVEAVRRAFEAARGYLELGLDGLAAGDEERAAGILATTPVKQIFREGFGRVLDLARRASEIRRRAGAARLGPPIDEALAALAGKRPRYFPGVEAPDGEWGTMAAAAHEPRHFRVPDDLARTARALDRAEASLPNAR